MTEENRAPPAGLGDDLPIFRAGVQDVGDSNGVEALFAKPLHDTAGDIDVGKKYHAAEGSSMLRPEASHAAY